MSEFVADVKEQLEAIEELLIEKNISYGDSALSPIRLFSRAGPIEQIKVRIDDKLTRLARGVGELGEDTILDLIGYLILFRIARQRERLESEVDR